MTNTDLEFFDLAPTAQAYREHRNSIVGAITQYSADIIEEKETIARLANLLPEPAINRMSLLGISWHPSRWYHRDSTREEPIETLNPHEALSKTAIIPSQTRYSRTDEGKLRCSVELYHMPPGFCDQEVGQIIATQRLVYELAHALVTTAWQNDHGPIRFPDGNMFAARAALYPFGALIESLGCGPISHYSAHFWHREKVRLLRVGNHEVQLRTELCETIAAHLLGFVHHPIDGQPNRVRSIDPLYDREPAREWVDQFLNATLI